MSDLPPASNKKPDGCVYPRCACNDSFCKEGNPMNNPVDELTLAMVQDEIRAHVGGWPDADADAERICRKVARLVKSTRAESPDSVDGEPARNHVWSADGETCINCGDKDWMGSKCSNAKNEMPPPPPVAAEGELIRSASLEATGLDLWAEDLLQIAKSKCGKVCEADQCCKERFNAGQLGDAARMIRELIAALQSRSTPPPVAGGVVISREDAEEVLAYCNADFIAQGALLNSCVLQTLTAKAIVEGRRCRMGAIAAKLEAALGERNNG